jgi:hypothetical protein
LPDKQRSQGHIARTDQIRLEAVMATLTDEEQARLRPIVKTGMPTYGTNLTGIVGIHFHRYMVCQQRLVSNVAMQLGKGQLGTSVIYFKKNIKYDIFELDIWR